MKSTFKRILALVMVLCTVAAWMVPGVAAEEAAETPASMTVDFVSLFNAAGIPADKYLQNYNDALATVYETYKFDFYRGEADAIIRPNALYAGGRYRGGKFLEISHNEKDGNHAHYGTTVTVPFKFVAPGTGDYELSFVYGKAYSKDNGGDEIGAYIMDMPETPYTKYNVPAPTAEGILAKASLANPTTGGKVTSEGTAALVEGQEYLIIFYVTDADAKAYANFTSFSLAPYVEPEETTEATTEATTVPEESLPEIEHKYDDMTVNFADYMTATGITGNSGSRFWSDGTAATAMDNNYASTNWTIYRNTDGAGVWTTYPPRFYSGGKLQFYANGKVNTEAFAITKFVAPGTGDYKLSLSTTKVSQADARADVAGAYILPYSDAYNKYSSLTYADKEGALVLNAEQLGAVATYTADGTVSLVTGQEYLLVFFAKDATNGKGKADFTGFSLTRQWPAASIGSNGYPTLGDALNVAVSGDTIVLGQDAFEYEVNVPEGVIVDLNGKTLNTGAFVGTAKDSADGKGLLISEADAVVTAAAGQVALWDIKPSAPGYRFFNYTFSNYGVSADENNTSGVDAEIDFYDYERNFLAQSFDEDGEVAKGAGDYKFKDVAAQIKADYDNGDTDWRLEYSNQQYQMGRGGVCFSWGNKSIRQFGAGYMAVRFAAPADGKVKVTLKTSSSDDADEVKAAAQDAGFTLYILKASDVEALYEGDYEALVDEFVADPATAVADLNTTIQTAYGAAEPVLTGVSDGNAYTGSYEFEDGQEYIAVFLNNGSVSGALHMNFQSISFKRYEQYGMTQSFVSKLTFTNTDAYDYIATGDSGLSVGFEMIWNGVNKFFEYDDATVAAWAQAEKDNADKDYGFYIRMSGFEALTESGELTGVAYMATENQWFTAEGETMTYEHTVAE